MAEQWELDEEGIRRLGALSLEQPELVESLSLQGSYAGKIHSIGDAFRNFKNLRSLDLSRNLITSLKGIQYLCSLQDLNLYYNNIPSLVEVSRLQPLSFLKELDLRLNPVVRKDTDYRLFAVYTLQTLEKLDDRAVRESERKAAKLHFSQLGNSENFLLEVEKSSREKTMKNCVTDASCTSKVSTNVDNRIETDSNKGLFIPFPNREIKDSLMSTSATQCNGIPDQKLDPFSLGTQMQEVARREVPSDNHQEDEFRHYSPRQSTVRSPEKMAREGYRMSFVDNKSSGSSPEKNVIPKPDTYQLTHDALLGKRLDVGDSSQIHPYQLPSDVGLEGYSQTLSLHGSLGKRPQRSKNYREYSIKPSNDVKATTSHSCGDLLTSLSNPDSSTERLLKLSSDLYATTHFNSDPAMLVNVEQQLPTSLGDLRPAHGSFPNNSVLGDSLRTLLLPTATSENRESLTKRSLSPSRRGFKRKDNILATLNPKHGFRDATCSEASPLSSDLGSLHGLPGNHSPQISARTSHVATVLRQLLELVDKHWTGSGSLLLNKKFLGPARDLLLTLVVPAPSQQWCRPHPEDASKALRRREMELKEAGQVVPNDMESLKQKLVRVLEENLILSEKIQQLEEGAATSVVSGHQPHTYDDLLRKNQQLNMQVACLNQELAQLKKLEETVSLLHESQRAIIWEDHHPLGKARCHPPHQWHMTRVSI
ncbi:leucine rich repeat containing 36 [Phyllostomus discolor]|uniref:Leucine rich repeat containing 36 n=1 Tax=Phyllostomus discolor TaxID=89673 RepID=A0A834DHK3_9CHIR|nr:leucine rich repeat containing 36 [Phyllostomus discolor]